MNIALMGAPGSHKSLLAERLAEHLRTAEPGQTGRSVAIVDGYTEDVEERAQMALGPFGDYLGNLYVALERYALERKARPRNDVTITCGTLVETAVYLSMHFVALGDALDEAAKADAAPKIDSVLRMMAVLYTEIFDYDHAFYLPPRAATEDVAYMDTQLRTGLEGFRLIPITNLLDPERQLEEALEALREVQPA